MILVDSTIWDAAKNKRDRNHDAAGEILKEIMDGTYGKPVITDYIMDEVLTWLNGHVNHEVAVEAANVFFETAQVEVQKVDWAILKEAYELFKKHDFLSFTDATSTIVIKMKGIKNVATFDKDFKKLGFNVIP